MHLVLLAAIVAGVFLEVYLIKAPTSSGAGQAALEARRTADFSVHGLEVLVFVFALVAWLTRRGAPDG